MFLRKSPESMQCLAHAEFIRQIGRVTPALRYPRRYPFPCITVHGSPNLTGQQLGSIDNLLVALLLLLEINVYFSGDVLSSFFFSLTVYRPLISP